MWEACLRARQALAWLCTPAPGGGHHAGAMRWCDWLCPRV